MFTKFARIFLKTTPLACASLFTISQFSFSTPVFMQSEVKNNPFKKIQKSLALIFDENDTFLGLSILVNNHLVFYVESNEKYSELVKKNINLNLRTFGSSKPISIKSFQLKEDENLVFINSKNANVSLTQTDTSIVNVAEIGSPITTIYGNKLDEFDITSGYVSGKLRLKPQFFTITQKLSLNTSNLNGFRICVNEQGQFIGFVVPGTMELIPHQHVVNLEKSLVNAGKFERPYLGMSLKSSKFAGDKVGLMVTNINEGSPAQLAGLKMGDIIYQIEETNTPAIEDLLKVIDYENNRNFQLMVYSKGTEKTKELLLGNQI